MTTPTSIYRPAGLSHSVAKPAHRIDRGESLTEDVAVDYTAQRKSAPVAFLLPNTRKWFDALPHGIQPHALCHAYARIANIIAATWTDAEALSAYFEELLGDRRRGRRGFPPDVFNNLHVLRDYYTGLHPLITRK